MFGYAVTRIDFEWIDSVKLILYKIVSWMSSDLCLDA